jgi:hypothetical protein
MGFMRGEDFISSFPRKQEPENFARLPWAPLSRGDDLKACAIGLRRRKREFRHGSGCAGFPPVEVAIPCRLAASGNFDDFYHIDPDLSN